MALIARDLGRVAYPAALELQEDLVVRKLAGESDDFLLLVEHDPVYTLGRGADEQDLRGADQLLGVPSCRIGRGGGVTFHGPGQLVIYPIVSLRGAERDLRRYVHRLENAIRHACSAWGLTTEAGHEPGVWVRGAKLASIGIGVRRWVTFHGLALNVSTDLSYFEAIVPCRNAATRMTSLARELTHCPPPHQIRAQMVTSLRAELDCADVDVAAETIAAAGAV